MAKPTTRCQQKNLKSNSGSIPGTEEQNQYAGLPQRKAPRAMVEKCMAWVSCMRMPPMR